MRLKRSSGILLHITSLPSAHGVGDLGPAAYEFVDFLSAAGQKYWQILPLNPTREEYAHSPYSSPSAFAGNPLLISPELLVMDGYLRQSDLKKTFRFNDGYVNFPNVLQFKSGILEKAYLNFKKSSQHQEQFINFCRNNQEWLEDYSLYVALKSHFDDSTWVEWPEKIRDRNITALQKISKELAEHVQKEKFFQFLFFHQWHILVEYGYKKGIEFIGDIPYYVNHDSADCWANTEFFKLDKDKKPLMVSGVPPDYFSETGQLWGTPVYNWDALRKKKFQWWVERIRQNLHMFDLVRLDHFRAFSAYWEVPADQETSINGQWTSCPGTELFNTIKEHFPAMPFIAEDLGTIDKPVHALRNKFMFPGMKVLLFAFGEDMADGAYIPHHHIPHSIVYTGTHDNNTVKGWYQRASPSDKRRLSAYAGRRITLANVTETVQRMALMSVANVAILPLQDALALGERAILNRPGTTSDNWIWRVLPGQLTAPLAIKLKSFNSIYGR